MLFALDFLPIITDFEDPNGLGYTPLWNTVASLSADNLTLSSVFGSLKNANPDNIQVTVKVSIKVPFGTGLGAKAAQFFIGSAGQSSLQATIISNTVDPATMARKKISISLKPIFKISFDSFIQPQLSVVRYPYQVSTHNLVRGGQVCLDLNVTVPGKESNQFFEKQQ